MTKQEIKREIMKMELVDEVLIYCDDIGLTEEEKNDFVEWWLFEKAFIG